MSLSPAVARALLAPLLLAASLALAPAAAAQTAFGTFPAEVLDGPDQRIHALGGVDMARDGTGGLVYIKDEGAVAHVFLSRFHGGVFQPPERVDLGVETAATAATVAAGPGNRLAIVFISGGRVYGSVASGGSVAPLPTPTLIYADQDPLRAVQHVAVDLGINGAAYAAFTAPGDGQTDVRAARLDGVTWTGVPQALDIIPAQAAGGPTGRPDVAVSAEGNAVITWGEVTGTGQQRVFARRVTGTALSVAPQEISVPDVDGAPGGPADSADIDVEDDGSYAWVAFRQDIGGVSRVLARRLVGSRFDPPVGIDGGGPAANPAIDLNGRGLGVGVAGVLAGDGVSGAEIKLDVFQSPIRLDTGPAGAAPRPAVAFSERRNATVAWVHNGAVVGRYKPDEQAWEPAQTLSRPEFGAAAPDGRIGIGTDSSGNMALAFLQGDGAARRLVVASYDRRPGLPVLSNGTGYSSRTRPELKWRPGSERWGPQTYRVFMDGKLLGTTTGTRFQVAEELEDGPHRWRVVAVDRRGQEAPSRFRYLRVDASPPAVRLRVAGRRARGAGLRFAVRAREVGRSGLNHVTLEFGDGTSTTVRTGRLRTVHRYGRSRTFVVRVRAVDDAGNVARLRRVVRVAK